MWRVIMRAVAVRIGSSVGSLLSDCQEQAGTWHAGTNQDWTIMNTEWHEY